MAELPIRGQLAHMVYFSLRDRSPDSVERLIAACQKYLSQHPGTIYFAAGTLNRDLQRDVNDRDFDVALQLVFESREMHDQYQSSERHQQFIEENREGWARVRVFDADVSS